MASEDVIYELAARLGSPVTFDRHGWVVWMTSFEEGLVHVETGVSGEDAAVALETTTARTGGYSAKLTAGKTVNKFASIIKRLHPPVVGKIGIEFSWARVPGSTYIDLIVVYYPVGTYYWGALRYDVAALKWQYLDSAGAWQDIETSLTLHSGAKTYHTMKLVLDFENHVYVRAMLDSYETSLADVALKSTSLSVGPYLHVIVRITDTATANPYIYVDDVIVTQNEP